MNAIMREAMDILVVNDAAKVKKQFWSFDNILSSDETII